MKKKDLTKEETKCYKMTERDIYEKFNNLSEDELDTKSNKSVYIKNIIMTNIIKHCRGKKKRGPRAIEGFRKKLKIPGYEISVNRSVKKTLRILILKFLEQKITDYLCNQNVVIVKIKSHDLLKNTMQKVY